MLRDWLIPAALFITGFASIIWLLIQFIRG